MTKCVNKKRVSNSPVAYTFYAAKFVDNAFALCDLDGDGRVGLSDLRALAKMLED